jgi:hypothetical protein
MISKGKIVGNNKMKVLNKKKAVKKIDMSHLSGHNSPKQNGGSESKLHMKKKTLKKAIKVSGSFEGKSNALGHGGRAAQLRAQGVPGGVIGALARRAHAAPGQVNYHGKKKISAGAKSYMKRVNKG